MVQLYPETVQKFSTDGKLIEEYDTIDGKKDGECIKFYPSGKISFRGNYVQDVPEGRFVEYHENGDINKTYFYKENKLEGEFVVRESYRNYTATYKDGKLHGRYTSWRKYPDVLMKTIDYIEGMKDGLEVEYDNDGIKLHSRCYHKNIMDGPSISYYPNGRIKDIVNYVGGNFTGEFREFPE